METHDMVVTRAAVLERKTLIKRWEDFLQTFLSFPTFRLMFVFLCTLVLCRFSLCTTTVGSRTLTLPHATFPNLFPSINLLHLNDRVGFDYFLKCINSVADLYRHILDTPSAQLFSFSCSIWGNWPRYWLTPPPPIGVSALLWNPESATDSYVPNFVFLYKAMELIELNIKWVANWPKLPLNTL